MATLSMEALLMVSRSGLGERLPGAERHQFRHRRYLLHTIRRNNAVQIESTSRESEKIPPMILGDAGRTLTQPTPDSRTAPELDILRGMPGSVTTSARLLGRSFRPTLNSHQIR